MAHEKHRLIAPRVPTRPGGSATGTVGLPDEVLSEQVQRLAVFSGVAVGLWTFALLMDTLVTPTTLGSEVSRRHIAVQLFAILTCVAVFLYIRHSDRPPDTKANAGLGLMLVNALAVALINTWVNTPSLAVIGYPSANTIVILA